jgi:ribose transport system permease protein
MRAQTPTLHVAPPLERGERLRRFITGYGVPLAFLLSVVVFSLLRPEAFPTWRNFNAILSLAAPTVVVALGITVVLAQGDFDLSFPSILGLSSALCFLLMVEDRVAWAWPVAVMVALFAGSVAGWVNGLVVSRLGLAPMISTLGMSTALVGVEYLFTNQETVYGNVPRTFTNLGQADGLLGLNNSVWIALGVVWIFYVLLEHTESGRYFYATGGNREAARLSGLPISRIRTFGYVLAGLAAGVAGVLLTAQTASSSPASGQPYLLPALAAAFLGTAMFRQGQFNVLGTLVGVLFLGVIQTGLIMLQLSTAIINIVQGVLLVGAILISRFGARG